MKTEVCYAANGVCESAWLTSVSPCCSTPSTMNVDSSSSPYGQQLLDPQTQAQADALVEYAWHQIFRESGTSRAPLK